MRRILKQFVLTMLFAVFASQASAMFIQPDWFDVTGPGVGTNRYAYSFNDPVNLRDPNGNDAYVGTRDIDGPTLFGAHGFVAIITNDPSLYGEYEDSFQVMTNTTGKIPGVEKGAEFHYMILSGDQTKNYNDPNPEENTLFGLTSQAVDHASFKELASGKNHNNNWFSYSLDELQELLDGKGNGGAVLDRKILDAFSSYCNCAPYQLFPKGSLGTYNSNSFARAISEQGGVKNFPDNLPGADFGSAVQIPGRYFIVPMHLGE